MQKAQLLAIVEAILIAPKLNLAADRESQDLLFQGAATHAMLIIESTDEVVAKGAWGGNVPDNDDDPQDAIDDKEGRGYFANALLGDFYSGYSGPETHRPFTEKDVLELIKAATYYDPGAEDWPALQNPYKQSLIEQYQPSEEEKAELARRIAKDKLPF